jgi:delta24(24(1))-sterol reductase
MTASINKNTNASDTEVEEKEFGGSFGSAIIMVFSHLIPYYLWYCVEYNNSGVAVPSAQMLSTIVEAATPTKKAAAIYLGYVLFEALLALLIPGLFINGLPLAHLKGKRLVYNCNAIQSWYITLITAAVLHYTQIFPLTNLIDNYAPILTVAIVFADLVSVLTYIITIANGRQHRMTGEFIYDFFMGAALNPRIGSLDIKMFSEARLSWIWLFLFTASAACKQYEVIGRVTPAMIFLLVAQGLYTNAIMKGEECIPTTWDIFYEKYGWYVEFDLIFSSCE